MTNEQLHRILEAAVTNRAIRKSKRTKMANIIEDKLPSNVIYVDFKAKKKIDKGA